MKAKELRAKSKGELQEELLKLRREQFNLRMARAAGHGAKPDQFGKVRKNIARLKTVMAEQRRAGVPAAAAVAVAAAKSEAKPAKRKTQSKVKSA